MIRLFRLAGWLVLATTVCSTSVVRAFDWPNRAARVALELKSPNPAVRRSATVLIPGLPDAERRRLTRQALQDPDPDVRLGAAEVVVHAAGGEFGELVVSWLNDPDRRLRQAAAEVLTHSPVSEAVAALGRLLSDPDAGVREAAARALGASASPQGTAALLGHLDETLPQVKEAVIAGLTRLGDPSSVIPLMGIAQDGRSGIRKAVVMALGSLGDARAVNALLLAIRDADEGVKISAIEALGRIRVREAVPALAALMREDKSSAVRGAAVVALGATATGDAVESLIQSLGMERGEAEEAALRRAIVALGSSAVPGLERCLTGATVPSMSQGCALALGAIGGPEAARLIGDVLRRGVIRPVTALEALRQAGDSSQISTVLEYLDDADAGAREAALVTAFSLLDPSTPDGRAVEPIRRALESTKTGSDAQIARVRLLGRTGSPRAVPFLLPLAGKDNPPSLRAAALEALGDIPPSGQDSSYLEGLRAAEPLVRWSAASAAWKSASGAAARSLLDGLEREPEIDRRALVVALSGAMAHNLDPAMAERTFRAAVQSRGGARDALLEALGRMPGRESSRLLTFFESSPDQADRRKVAEALAEHPEAVQSLRRLSQDPDPEVRATAIWSLSAVGTNDDLHRLERSARDSEVTVAGNSVGALARISRRLHLSNSESLCTSLGDPRSYVRANSVAGLILLRQRCEPDKARQLLSDPSELVRQRAALLIRVVPSPEPNADRAALERCSTRDRSGVVAQTCSSRRLVRAPTGIAPVGVYVVPAGESQPVPEAPFSLLLADGLLRLGTSDRRGSVFEAKAPSGPVSLEVPAPLAR